MSYDLIPVFQATIGQSSVNAVNARELHAFLEVKSKFADWIKNRIQEYEFQQDVDFVCILNFENSPPSKEYYITLDMAKELAMVERNTKGKQARQYFIECEKRLKETVANPAPIDPPIFAGMRLFAQAHEFAKTILELNPNQAKLSADVCCKKSLNLSVLGHFDITYLPANEKGQTYTPTQLGAEWLDPPASGRYMNLLLKDVGLQVKDREKHWIPTELANGYYEWVDTTKQHCVGTPIKQVRWYITVLDKMREILREREAQQQAA